MSYKTLPDSNQQKYNCQNSLIIFLDVRTSLILEYDKALLISVYCASRTRCLPTVALKYPASAACVSIKSSSCTPCVCVCVCVLARFYSGLSGLCCLYARTPQDETVGLFLIGQIWANIRLCLSKPLYSHHIRLFCYRRLPQQLRKNLLDKLLSEILFQLKQHFLHLQKLTVETRRRGDCGVVTLIYCHSCGVTCNLDLCQHSTRGLNSIFSRLYTTPVRRFPSVSPHSSILVLPLLTVMG